MATKSRKDRKRSGIKFERTPKVGTPYELRGTNVSRYFFQWNPRQKNQNYGISNRFSRKMSGISRLLARGDE